MDEDDLWTMLIVGLVEKHKWLIDQVVEVCTENENSEIMMNMTMMNMIIMNTRVPSHLVLALLIMYGFIIINVNIKENISTSLLGKIYPTSLVAYAVLGGCVCYSHTTETINSMLIHQMRTSV